MDRHKIFAWSLERVAERHGDPTPVVYASLFAQRPEFERLFAMDRTGAVRGNMLSIAFDALLDISGPNRWGLNLIMAERVNHEGVNVPSTEFLVFINVVRDTVRDLLGEEWTPPVAAAWAHVLANIDAAYADSSVDP